MGDRCAAATKEPAPVAEKRRMDKGAPAGRPDVEPLIQIAASQLLGDGGEASEGGAGNDEPESSQKGRQGKNSGHHTPGVAPREENGGAGKRDQRSQKPRARSSEQHGDEAHGQKPKSQQAGELVSFALQEQGREWKAEIEKTGNIVGILTIGGKAELACGNGFRRAEGNQSEGSQHPRAGHEGAQKVAQIGGSVGKFPNQPDDHYFLKVRANFFERRGGVDGPEIGTADPEKQDKRQPAERAGIAHAAGLKNCRNGGEKREQTRDAGHVAQRFAEIEGVLPRDGEGEDEEQNPRAMAYRSSC